MVRRDILAGPGMKSLTFCEANVMRLEVRTVNVMDIAKPAWNDSLPVKSPGSDWE